ncbi:MAG: hypothetical protein M1820_004396 [Bogoriella megaspora]|nr:MAG: hypothetical protein M1820_004396 [Bogoriella megaspora]
MEDDMDEHSPSLGAEDFKQAAELSKYRLQLYDDTDKQENGYDSDDSEAMLRFATSMSTENQTLDETQEKVVTFQAEDRRTEDVNDHDSENSEAMLKLALELSKEPSEQSGMKGDDAQAGPSKMSQSSQDAQTDRSGPESSEATEECDFCPLVPEFPGSHKVRKFRLIRPSDMVPIPPHGDICSHYVAISYCWPNSEQDQNGNLIEPERTYHVRDLDGTIRSNRALDDVLDRAVEFAISCGLRMIWIDQECLPQPNEDGQADKKKEHELGVQAMDIIYNRAVVTAGLPTAEITQQEQLDAVKNLLRFKVTEVGKRLLQDMS